MKKRLPQFGVEELLSSCDQRVGNSIRDPCGPHVNRLLRKQTPGCCRRQSVSVFHSVDLCVNVTSLMKRFKQSVDLKGAT